MTFTALEGPERTCDLAFEATSAGDVLLLDSSGEDVRRERIEPVLEGALIRVGQGVCTATVIRYDDSTLFPDPAASGAGAVIWNLGSRRQADPEQVAAMELLLDAGAGVWVTGSATASALFNTPLLARLGAGLQGVVSDPAALTGIAGDPVGDGFEGSLAGWDGTGSLGTCRSLSLADGGIGVLRYGTGQWAAVRVESDSERGLLFGFPLEAVEGPSAREELLARTIGYLLRLNVPVEEGELTASPNDFRLHAPRPNPFNPATMVAVTLPREGDIRVDVCNILGRTVAQLASGSFPAGRHQWVLEGRDLASGTYLVRAQFEGESRIVRAILLK